MKYSTEKAFRQALEARIRAEKTSQAIQKKRKMVAFERLMIRLSDRWILKGGYALQLRTNTARTTMDIDLLILDVTPEEIHQTLLKELQQDTGDFFTFDVIPTKQLDEEVQAIRFRIVAKLDNRPFERFHIDIGYHDTLSDSLERLNPPDFLSFAEMPNRKILCYSAYQHLAEKVHAIVLTRPNTSSRVKDMIDILIFASIDEKLECKRLRDVTQSVFSDRGTQLPEEFNHIPEHWGPRYHTFRDEIDLNFPDFDESVHKVNAFLNPVLNEKGKGVWHPDRWQWIAD